MSYTISLETITTIVNLYNESGNDHLEVSFITNYLDSIRETTCLWKYERGKKLGQRCPNNVEEGIPYCKTCKNKVKAKTYMVQHGFRSDDSKNNGPIRPTNQLKKSIIGRTHSTYDQTKYRATPVPNHPEYVREQTFNFVLRTTINAEVYAEAIFDDNNHTVRNLTPNEIKIAISKKFLISKDGITDLNLLKDIIYPVKDEFCGTTMSIQTALSEFTLDEQDITPKF
uniref:Uncharacterized protein n=1 Tax=Pithovirus LCPAC403 TaxID=2506596 RepID=A0A481ZCT4_9VIRU|nr:MAG: uncharacterized protein LCPAC403_04190 [Pithovirus LCPAC403]